MAFFKKRRAAKARKESSGDHQADPQEDDVRGLKILGWRISKKDHQADPEEDDIRADTEVWLTRQGLPHLIQNYSATQDIFTRMTPFLIIVFFAEVGFGFGNRFSGWVQAEIIGLFFLASIGSGLILNLIQKRHIFALPRRVGALEIGTFVVVPALLSMISANRPLFTFIAVAILNIILVAGGFVLTSYGVVPMLRWTLEFMWAQARDMVRLIARSLPMSLLFAGFFFLNTEMWQIASDYTPLFYAINIGMIVVSGLIFIFTRIPDEVMSLERFHSWEEVREIVSNTDSPLADVELDEEIAKEEFAGVSLSRGATSNIELLLLLSQVVRFLMAGLVIGVFFFLLGVFAIRRVVIEQWLRDDHISEIWTGYILGGEIMLTWQLVAVSGFIASFASLQFVVTTMTDKDYREHFFTDMVTRLREVLAVRRQYLTLPEPRGEN